MGATMPWILLPILPLFTCYMAIADNLRVWPAYLLVPVAGWLGRRYGTSGIVTGAIGALAALSPTLQLGPFEFGGTPDLYVVAIWVCVACAAKDPLRALIGDGRFFRSSFVFVAALIVLPMSLGLGGHELEDGTRLSLWIGLRPLFLFGLFLFGLAGFPPKRAVAALAVAAIAGVAIRFFDIDRLISGSIAAHIDPAAPWVNDFRLRYEWNDAATLITGLVCFFAGGLVNQRRTGDRERSVLWRHPYLAIAILTILPALGTIAGQLLPPLPAPVDLTGLYGDYYALPVAGFLAGFLLYHLGVAICLGLFVALIAGSNLAAFLLGIGGWSISLEQPFICLGYGLLGVGARTFLDGVATPFKAKRWLQYAGLVLGILAIVTSSSELVEVATLVLIAIGGALMAIVVQRFRRKLDRRGIRITGDGWLLLGVIVVVLAWAVFNARIIASSLFIMAADYDISEGMAWVIVIVLSHIPVALLAAGLTRCLPKVWGDIRLLIMTGRAPE